MAYRNRHCGHGWVWKLNPLLTELASELRRYGRICCRQHPLQPRGFLQRDRSFARQRMVRTRDNKKSIIEHPFESQAVVTEDVLRTDCNIDGSGNYFASQCLRVKLCDLKSESRADAEYAVDDGG
jgi:hypothetical protein